jgi:hypothetical protein
MRRSTVSAEVVTRPVIGRAGDPTTSLAGQETILAMCGGIPVGANTTADVRRPPPAPHHHGWRHQN